MQQGRVNVVNARKWDHTKAPNMCALGPILGIMSAKSQMGDNDSVRTPTRSELNTFKVLANLDFTNFSRPDPGTRTALGGHEVVLERHNEERSQDHRDDRSERSSVRSHSDRSSSHRSHRSEVQDDRSVEAPGGAPGPSAAPLESEPSTPRRPFGSAPTIAGGEDVDTPRNNTFSKFPESVRLDIDPDILAATKEDIALEKEALLYELDIMEKQGALTLHRKLTMNDSLEAIQYQYDRANMIASTQQSVEWAKTALRMGSTVLEAVLKRFGLSVVDGFSNNLCKDMNRFNKPLTKMYRKYWRRGSSSPEMELAMIVVGALVMTVVANKGLLGSLFGGGSKAESKADAAKQEAPAAPKPTEVSTMKPPSVGNFMQPPFATGPINGGPMGPMATMMAAPRPLGPTTISAAAIPEWAKAALAGPVGAPDKPAHFATAPAWPEERRAPPPPMMPVSLAAAQNAALAAVPRIPSAPPRPPAPIARITPVTAPVSVAVPATPAEPEPTEADSVAPPSASTIPPPRAGIVESVGVTRAREDHNVRRLTLASPKSNRKKREPVAELNLDDE